MTNRRWAMFTVSYVALGIGALLVQGNEGIQPCQFEDSAGPCYWDATTMGNGLGRSFVAWEGVSQDDVETCAYWDGWGEPECVVAAMTKPGESLTDTMIRLGY